MSDTTIAGVRQRLAGCFTAAFPELDPAKVETATMDSVPQWDSMYTLNIVALVEEEFDIMIGIDEIGALASFKAFEDCVSRHVGPG
jgi:acyl carrier protein